MQSDFKKELLRKSIHLTSLWMPLTIASLDKWVAATLFAVLLVGMVVIEASRKKDGGLGKIFLRYFSLVLREHETTGGKWTGATFMLISSLLCVVLLERNIALFATLVMIISDTAAALVGKAFGKKKIGSKSVEGSAAFMLTALLIAASLWIVENETPAFFLSVAAGAVAATIAELFSKQLRLDDNLAICLAAGGGAQLLMFVL